MRCKGNSSGFAAPLVVRPRAANSQPIALIETGNLIQILEHPDGDKYPGQWLFEINVDGYVYVVPVVRQGSTLFLKTVYPGRKATKHSKKGALQ